MCATIAAMAVQITRTQIATPMARAISDVASSFTFMISPSVRGCIPDSTTRRQGATVDRLSQSAVVGLIFASTTRNPDAQRARKQG
jgi:hypothetical protein